MLGLTAVGYFCLGMLVCLRAVARWRIRWIELEHDLARRENREPRNIDDFLKAEKSKP